MNPNDPPTGYLLSVNPDTGEEELMAYWMPDGQPLPERKEGGE